MAKKNYTIPLIIAHAILIVLAYSSPFWLDWRIITFGVLLSYVQIIVAGSCVLSIAQFEDKDMTFHEWYLSKLGIQVNRPKFNFVLRYIMPLIILTIALLFQVIRHNSVLVAL